MEKIMHNIIYSNYFLSVIVILYLKWFIEMFELFLMMLNKHNYSQNSDRVIIIL